MSHSMPFPSNDDSAETFAAKPILKLFEKKHAALWHAARLLGGYDASRVVDRCADLLDANRSITNRTWMMLEQ